MNLYALTIGFLTAILTTRILGNHKYTCRRAAYTWYLASFTVYYWVFALFTGSLAILYKEIAVGMVFFLLAGVSLKLNSDSWPLLLGFAYLLHAGYDIIHADWFANPATPSWWPEFCGIIDSLLGLYIIGFVITQRRQNLVSSVRGDL